MTVAIANGQQTYISLGVHPLRDQSACLSALTGTRYSLDGTGLFVPPPIIPFVPSDGLGYDFYGERDKYSVLARIFTNATIGDPVNVNAAKAITFGTKKIVSTGVYYPPEYFDYDAPYLPFPYVPVGSSNSGQASIQGIPFTAEYYRIQPKATLNTNHPNYRSLVTGYSLDPRTIPSNPIITSDIDKTIIIKYYQNNPLEPIPNLKSICWRVYEVSFKANIPQPLPIDNCVLGTLYINDAIIENSLVALPVLQNKYAWSDLLSPAIPSLFVGWKLLFDATNDNPNNLPLLNQVITLRKLATRRNYWDNVNLQSNVNINFDITHPMFAIDNQRAYNWHIKPQADGSYGNLIMDSPRTIEIRLMIEQLIKALNALEYQNETPAIIGTGTIDNPQTPATHKLDWYIKNSAGEKVTAIWKALGGNKYGTNQIDNTKERVTNLGFLVERIAKVLGIRFDDNGKIDVDKEKSMVRKVIDGSQKIDPEKVGINGYGDGGMVVKRINNRFKKKGQIVSDQCVVIQDMPDLIQEYFEQANLALGIQESSAIEIKQGGTAARFNSQLEILLDLVNLMSSGNEMIRAALVSSLVTQSQTNELIAGLGLPSVTKTIPVQIGKKVTQLPFKGIAAHRSMSQEIATCTYNVGIALGQVL